MDRLQSMRVFLRVVDEGGFAAAARALDLSPAVVTRLIADLEGHLGTRLLQRSTRRLSLTEAGEIYLGRVRGILDDIDEADAVATLQTHELAGVLRVHAPPVLASYVLAPLIMGFRQRYPNIVLDVEVAAPQELPIEDYDVTLLGTDISFDANVVARKIIEVDSILVASAQYLQRHGMPQNPGDLTRHDCLRLKQPGGHRHLWRMWPDRHPDQALNLDIQPVLWANHTDTLLKATLDGAGISSFSVDIVALDLARGELVRVLHPWVTGHLAMYAALPSRKFVPQRTQAFLDYLTEQTRHQTKTAMAAYGRR